MWLICDFIVISFSTCIINPPLPQRSLDKYIAIVEENIGGDDDEAELVDFQAGKG